MSNQLREIRQNPDGTIDYILSDGTELLNVQITSIEYPPLQPGDVECKIATTERCDRPLDFHVNPIYWPDGYTNE